jgi:hypothetical protein
LKSAGCCTTAWTSRGICLMIFNRSTRSRNAEQARLPFRPNSEILFRFTLPAGRASI